MMTCKTIIVDDERLARAELKKTAAGISRN